MHKTDVIKQIREIGVIPVVRATTAEEAMRAIDAILEGGISVLEITMTVPNAFSLIEQVTGRFGSDALVGAGTVLDAETAKSCIASGAQFIVSPALNLDTIAYCREHLAAYKCPKTVDIKDELPRNPTGKILKKDLRKPYWDGRDRATV